VKAVPSLLRRRVRAFGTVLALIVCFGLTACSTSTGPALDPVPVGTDQGAASTAATPTPWAGREYPLHRKIVATTFWVGEISDPNSRDGSQMVSTYDYQWLAHYGGCDGIEEGGVCRTEPRTAVNGFFPTRMAPLQNPYYLDLPFDDLHNPIAFRQRATVVPWANDPGYTGNGTDRSFSYLKNRWVGISNGHRTCYGQIEDAGPAQYHDARYVFGVDDPRPANHKFNHAGMDVSPALNGCLGFRELNGASDTVDWRFVDDVDVPPGPWRRIITTQPPVETP
jgi:hypothetical protein